MRARPLLMAATVAAAMAISAAGAAFIPRTAVDGAAIDAAAALRTFLSPAPERRSAAALILLDEKSLASERLAGTPRALMAPVWAETAELALASGARSIGYDFVFAFDAADLKIGGETPLARYDDDFLRLLRKEGRAGRLVIGRSAALPARPRFALMAGPKGQGNVEIEADPDGVVRRIRDAFRTSDGGLSPTLLGSLTGRAEGEEVSIIPPAPLDALPAIGLSDLLDCRDAGGAGLEDFFRGRVILVGGALPGEDRFRTADRFMGPASPPVGPCGAAAPVTRGQGGDIPGVYLHAAAADARISGWAPAPAPKALIGAVAAIAAALAALAGLFFAPGWAAGAAIAIALAGIAGSAAALEIGMQAPAARPGGSAALGFAFGWATRLLMLDRRTRALRASFSRYLAPALVDRIVAQDRPPDLAGETREVAIMFADLSGFTALTERARVAGEEKLLTATLNAYLAIITGEVERTGGYVDKFIGDAVMAIWGAPTERAAPGLDAVRAAASIRDAVAARAAEDRARGLPNFAVKVGVHCGPAIVGNVGTETRMNYTAIGDTVNIAARLEGLSAGFGSRIALGEPAARAAAAEFAMLEIASIRVKGKSEPVGVFAPFPRRAEAGFGPYAAALSLYRAGRFAEAEAAFRSVAAAGGPEAAIAEAMAGHAADAAVGPPPEPGWDGAVTMRTK